MDFKNVIIFFVIFLKLKILIKKSLILIKSTFISSSKQSLISEVLVFVTLSLLWENRKF